MRLEKRVGNLPFMNMPDGRVISPGTRPGVVIRYRASKNGPLRFYTAIGQKSLYTEAEAVEVLTGDDTQGLFQFLAVKKPVIYVQTLYRGKK